MNASPLKFTEANFDREVLTSAEPVLVDFWASWCGPCRIVGPIIDAIADEFAGRVKVGKLNVDDNPQTATKYGIEGIPSLLIFQNGQVVDRVVGVTPQAAIADRLNAVLERSTQSVQTV